MSTPSWPIGLPKLRSNVSSQLNENVKKSSMQTGPAKVIQEDNVSFYVVTGDFVMTLTQYATFYTFLTTTIGYGSIPFLFNHPITRVDTLFTLLSYGPQQQVGPTQVQFTVTLQEVPS